MGINNELYVIVNIWTSKGRKPIEGVNFEHASITTPYDHISLWPGKRPRKTSQTCSPKPEEMLKNIFSDFAERSPSFKDNYEQDCVFEAFREKHYRLIQDVSELREDETLYKFDSETYTFERITEIGFSKETDLILAIKLVPANFRVVLYSLNDQEIENKFKDLKEDGITGWSMAGSNALSRTINDQTSENCTFVVYRCLTAGGLYAELRPQPFFQTPSMVAPHDLLEYIVATKEKELRKYPISAEWTLEGGFSLDEPRGLILLKQVYEKRFEEAKKIYSANPVFFHTFLWQDIKSRRKYEYSLALERETKALIDFFFKLELENPNKDLTYTSFQNYLSLGDVDSVNKALVLYRTHLSDKDMTGEDLHNLGDASFANFGNRLEKGSRTTRIKRLEQACGYYYQAYQKGYRESWRLLIRFLREKEALEKKTTPLNLAVDEESTQKDEVLIAEFILYMKKKKAPWLDFNLYSQVLIHHKANILHGIQNDTLDFKSVVKACGKDDIGEQLQNLLVKNYYLEQWNSYYSSHLDEVIAYLVNITEAECIAFVEKLLPNQQLSLLQSAQICRSKNTITIEAIKRCEHLEEKLYFLLNLAIEISCAPWVENRVCWLAFSIPLGLLVGLMSLLPTLIGFVVTLTKTCLQKEQQERESRYGYPKQIEQLEQQLNGRFFSPKVVISSAPEVALDASYSI